MRWQDFFKNPENRVILFSEKNLARALHELGHSNITISEMNRVEPRSAGKWVNGEYQRTCKSRFCEKPLLILLEHGQALVITPDMLKHVDLFIVEPRGLSTMCC